MYRQILDSPHWQLSTPEVRNVMVVCFLKANFADVEWFDGQENILIKRGSFVTTRERLVAECGTGITEKQVRLALEKLSVGQVIGKRTVQRGEHSYLHITVIKYDDFQCEVEARARDGQDTGIETGIRRATSKNIRTKELRIKELNNNKDKNLVAVNGHSRMITPIDEFFVRYEKRLNQKPVIQGGRDGKLLGDIDKQLGRDEYCRRLDLFFESTDDFIVKAGYTVGVFVSQVNKVGVALGRSLTPGEKTRLSSWRPT